MNRINPNPSILSVGLKKYLDQNTNKHCGFGYDNFVTMVSNNVPKASIAYAFGVSRHTVIKWLVVHNIEKQKGEDYEEDINKHKD